MIASELIRQHRGVARVVVSPFPLHLLNCSLLGKIAPLATEYEAVCMAGAAASGIRSLEEGTPPKTSWVVYLGERELKEGSTWILRAQSFLRKLHASEVLTTA